MTDDSTMDLGRSGDATRAWTSKEEEAKHYARAFHNEILGGYRIMREIGHGSMGIVFLGEHTTDGAKAAVKILPPSLSITTTVIKRFLREAESVAKLDHDGIVKIFAVGEERGIHFYAMQFVEGASLDKVLRQRRFSVRECASIIAGAARALFVAHEAGIMHRDIKPGNLILTGKDRPVLTDFGLAKPEKAATLTESGALVGTPIYMSPEQVRADKTLIDRRSDIYSLGITLYEMLTGVTPFEGQSTQEILQKIEHDDPTPVRKMRPDCPREIDIICHKAIEKDPGRRYQTAIEMALDLERFLRGEPIEARPASFASRVIRKVKRHPTVSGLSLALLLTCGVVALQGVLNRSQREKTQDALEQADLEKYARRIADAATARASVGASEAIVIYSEAIGLFPDRVDAYVERGACYFEMNAYEKAIADFDHALMLNPSYHRARLWRGVTKCRDGTREEQLAGVEDLRATQDVLVDDPECLYLSSQACLLLAQEEGSPIARDGFLDIVERRLQHLLAKIPEIEAAARQKGETVRLMYRQDDALVLQGMLYEEQGMLGEARSNYRRALDLDPGNLNARVLLQDREELVANGSARQTVPRGSSWLTTLATEGLAWAKGRLESDPDFLRRAADSLNVYRDKPSVEPSELSDEMTPAALDRKLIQADELWRAGDEKGAAAIYEQVLRYLPTIDACCRLAEHCLRQPDRSSDAMRYADAALRVNATNPYALTVAVQVYSKVGESRRVGELARQIATFHPALLEKAEVRDAIQPFVELETLRSESSAKPTSDGD